MACLWHHLYPLARMMMAFLAGNGGGMCRMYVVRECLLHRCVVVIVNPADACVVLCVPMCRTLGDSIAGISNAGCNGARVGGAVLTNA